MRIQDIIQELEILAPPSLQESYDNAGLLTGDASHECTGILVALDSTEAIIAEARSNGCNLVVTHHPIIFGGLKKITGKNYVERTVIQAIKNDIAIYAIHTNLDNVQAGVNAKIAEKLGLINTRILAPKSGQLVKLVTYVPVANAETVLAALFNAGAGHIGNYSECSFSSNGTGTYKPGAGTDPYIGQQGERSATPEVKIEVILSVYHQRKVVNALLATHPYEEVAYDLLPLANEHAGAGSGYLGELTEPMTETAFLQIVKEAFNLQVIRHTPFLQRKVQKIAVCGGAGSFLTGKAIAAGADVYLTADVKYHEFFDADGKLLLADIGHFESEQYTTDLLFDVLRTKFPNFAVLKTKVNTNPVNYF
jgi:dinuclear metal center YbgI/SA1388 family protein